MDGLVLRYGSGKNLLRTLRLKHLAFAETDISDLSQLRFLPGCCCHRSACCYFRH